MEPINHFGDSEPKTIIVFGSEFKYKELLVEDELQIDFSYCYDGEVFNLKKYKLLRLAHNLKKVPYTIENIKEMIGVNSSWEDLDISNRIKLFNKLRSIALSKLLVEADKIDLFDEEVKKKSSI